MSMSSDSGATWKPYSRPPYIISDAVLETPESGAAMRIDMGAFSAALEIYSYDPRIGDWRKTGDPPPAARSCSATPATASGFVGR